MKTERDVKSLLLHRREGQPASTYGACHMKTQEGRGSLGGPQPAAWGPRPPRSPSPQSAPNDAPTCLSS
eukprot:scaffold81269_cov36-Tisochrysis_lutea.AAC.3